MKIARSSTYYPNQYIHKIGENLTVDITIDANPYELPVETLYEMAARINKKRSFLFVSKVLGKHIPLNPKVPLIASALLASIYYESKMLKGVPNKEVLINALIDGSTDKLHTAYEVVKKLDYEMDERILFIGFAETATALGHAVYDCFSNADYIHSTREMLVDQEVTLYFEEEHSHATDQRCYAPEHYLNNDRQICLVDDEITTGKTALNIIASIQKRFPRKEYAVLSLLDWRSEEDRVLLKAFEKAHDVKINVYALLSGTISVQGVPNISEGHQVEEEMIDTPPYNRINIGSFSVPSPSYSYHSVDSIGIGNEAPYLALTGRFGIHSEGKVKAEAYFEQIGAYLQTLRQGEKTLCLGTGEFMHIPMKTAVYMGEGIHYHSTTRSPIFPMSQEHYPIKSRFQYESPDDPSIMNYAYNVLDQQYDEVFLFFERTIEADRLKPMLRQFKHIPIVHIVGFI